MLRVAVPHTLFTAAKRAVAPVRLMATFVCLTLGFEPALAQSEAKPPAGPPAALVRVDAVREEPMVQTVPVIGRLVARQAGNVAARIAGPVESFSVEVGDRVAKGDVIAVLNPDTMAVRKTLAEGGVEEAQADLATAQAEATLAEQELDRLEGLRKTVAFPQGRFDDARQRVVVAKARVTKAKVAIVARKANLRLADLNMYYSRILAPYDGVITRRLTEMGSYVRAGDSVVQMVGDRSLEIEADVPSNRLSGLKKGTVVQVVLDDGRRFDAGVRAALPSENPLTRTRAVRLVPDFGTELQGLADGQSVTVAVPVGAQRDAVTVHKDAIIKKVSGSVVFVVVDGKANIRPIRLGEATGARVEVIDGLKVGENVVVRGNERLQPGAAVRVDGGS